MPTCKKCGQSKPVEGWPRYERNGTLTVLCAECNAQSEQDRPNMRRHGSETRICLVCKAEKPNEEFYLMSSKGLRMSDCKSCHAQMHRSEREAEALAEGREFASRDAEFYAHALMKEAEQIADRTRATWAREWMKPFREAWEREYLQSDEYHKDAREKQRAYYSANPDRERDRVKRYKHANPEKLIAHGDRRVRRAAMQSDGTLERDTIGHLFAAATKCPYCGVKLTSRTKSLDHMIPLSLGGLHGLSNVLICCRPCNLKKRAAPYLDWLSRLDAKRQGQARKLYQKIQGSQPEQGKLTLQWEVQ